MASFLEPCADCGANLQLRDFLQKSLYDLEEGYFTAARANAPVGSVGKALAFSQLAGEDGYRRAVREAYDSLEVSLSWLKSVAFPKIPRYDLSILRQTHPVHYMIHWGLPTRPLAPSTCLPTSYTILTKKP